jgi:hypothetical protein
MLVLLPHAGKSLHHTCTSSRGYGPAGCRAFGLCSQAHTKACHARRSCEPSAPRRSERIGILSLREGIVRRLVQISCGAVSRLSTSSCVISGQIRSGKCRWRSAPELWASTHEAARAPVVEND